MAIHIGEAAPHAVVLEREPLVIEPHEMQDRGMQVMNMHTIFNRLHAQFVRRAVDVAPLDGIRPNSVHHTTSVSSSSPRCFRSRMSAAAG